MARTEDLPELYQRPYDPKRPLVCIDERPVQLVSGVRAPLPVAPRRPARYDMSTAARAWPTCPWSSSRCWAGGRRG
ncbi:MAG TPA: hypothetical protein VIL46_08830 [Gemmataceae bacterium]